MLNTTTREGKIQEIKTYISILNEMVDNSYQFASENRMDAYSRDTLHLSESYKEKDAVLTAS